MLNLEKSTPDDPKEVRIYPKGLEAMGKIERPHLGMKMYAVDQRTRECTEAQYKTISLPQSRDEVHHQYKNMNITESHAQVMFDAGKYYVWAINKKSAVRKFVRAVKDFQKKMCV